MDYTHLKKKSWWIEQTHWGISHIYNLLQHVWGHFIEAGEVVLHLIRFGQLHTRCLEPRLLDHTQTLVLKLKSRITNRFNMRFFFIGKQNKISIFNIWGLRRCALQVSVCIKIPVIVTTNHTLCSTVREIITYQDHNHIMI